MSGKFYITHIRYVNVNNCLLNISSNVVQETFMPFLVDIEIDISLFCNVAPIYSGYSVHWGIWNGLTIINLWNHAG